MNFAQPLLKMCFITITDSLPRITVAISSFQYFHLQMQFKLVFIAWLEHFKWKYLGISDIARTFQSALVSFETIWSVFRKCVKVFNRNKTSFCSVNEIICFPSMKEVNISVLSVDWNVFSVTSDLNGKLSMQVVGCWIEINYTWGSAI